MTQERPSPRCAMCLRAPAEIAELATYLDPGQTADEYVAEEEGTFDPAAEYVAEEEGTFDPETGAFLCDVCYVLAGQPSLPFPRRWTATPANLQALGL